MNTLANGRFELLEVLGSGATSTVHRARDTVLGVDRAVKILRGARSTRERGLGEARALARLEHPNILRIYDVGEEAGQLWVVMELAESGSLEDRLQRDGPLSPKDAIGRMLDVLAALEAAHGAGIVHRDVKPANVLIGPRGATLLGDFGIARLPIAVAVRETRAGAVLGSFGFMPPEQRLDARKVGPASDVYAAGATLYALLTGANPVDLFLAEPNSPRWMGVPAPLLPILQKATRAEPEARHASATELAAALREVLPEVEAVTAAPASGSNDSEPTAESVPSWGEPASLLDPEERLPAVGAPAPPPAPAPSPPVAPAPRSRAAWLALPLVLALPALAWWASQRPGPPAEANTVAPPPTPAPVPAPPGSPTPVPQAAPTPVQTAPKADAGESSPDKVGPPGSPVATVKPASARFGRWSGTFNGRSADLELEGPPDALQGQFLVRLNGRVVSSRVAGAFDPASGRLTLHDTEETPDAGSYAATLADGRLTGSFTRADGGRMVPLILDAK